MSESEQAKSVVFRVVDRLGGRHTVTAERMVTDGDVVVFVDGGRNEIASFNHPNSAAQADKSTYSEAFGLTPGAVVDFTPSKMSDDPLTLVCMWVGALSIVAIAGLGYAQAFGLIAI